MSKNKNFNIKTFLKEEVYFHSKIFILVGHTCEFQNTKKKFLLLQIFVPTEDQKFFKKRVEIQFLFVLIILGYMIALEHLSLFHMKKKHLILQKNKKTN